MFVVISLVDGCASKYSFYSVTQLLYNPCCHSVWRLFLLRFLYPMRASILKLSCIFQFILAWSSIAELSVIFFGKTGFNTVALVDRSWKIFVKLVHQLKWKIKPIKIRCLDVAHSCVWNLFESTVDTTKFKNELFCTK